jgi:Fe-S cluster biogenesis protein NfuA
MNRGQKDASIMNTPAESHDSEGTAAPSLEQRVREVLEMIRPAIQADGGDLELVAIDSDGVVSVRLHGACVGCPSANVTLQMGIEQNLRERVPEVKAVRSVR